MKKALGEEDQDNSTNNTEDTSRSDKRFEECFKRYGPSENITAARFVGETWK